MTRKISFFEGVLLFIGLVVGIVGFYFIQQQLQQDGMMSWNFILSVLVWLVLLVLFIIAALVVDVKEELKILLQDHSEEIRLLKTETAFMKEISHEQLEELKLLRGFMDKGRK
ncbi:hypothetical protein HYY69_02645 [Candidatus Woesearchaeota archaeon]|nr:hypothetical protein [Candidatus Woesearchaeota archaeon]